MGCKGVDIAVSSILRVYVSLGFKICILDNKNLPVRWVYGMHIRGSFYGVIICCLTCKIRKITYTYMLIDCTSVHRDNLVGVYVCLLHEAMLIKRGSTSGLG